ncbi:16247_t:CDS:1, partial [Dentiscutata heterogama]
SKFSDSKTVKKLQNQQQDKEARSHKKKEVENIIQDVFDFMMDESDKNHMAKFLLTS